MPNQPFSEGNVWYFGMKGACRRRYRQRRHGATHWQVYDWRRKLAAGKLAVPEAALSEPVFAALVVETAPSASRVPARKTAGRIELVVDEVALLALHDCQSAVEGTIVDCAPEVVSLPEEMMPPVRERNTFGNIWDVNPSEALGIFPLSDFDACCELADILSARCGDDTCMGFPPEAEARNGLASLVESLRKDGLLDERLCIRRGKLRVLFATRGVQVTFVVVAELLAQRRVHQACPQSADYNALNLVLEDGEPVAPGASVAGDRAAVMLL